MAARVPRYQWYIGGPKHGQRIVQTPQGLKHIAVSVELDGSYRNVMYHEETFLLAGKPMKVWVADSLSSAHDRHHVELQLLDHIIDKITCRSA